MTEQDHDAVVLGETDRLWILRRFWAVVIERSRIASDEAARRRIDNEPVKPGFADLFVEESRGKTG